MSKITIKSLSLQNFKGIARMDMTFHDGVNSVRAKNGSGKTSLMYAFWWAMGLDVPEVIPTIDNKEIHNLETKVTAVVIKDTFEYNLCRVQTEKWKVNRATGEEEKHTNESAYYIDDVAYTLKNYKEKLSALFGFAYEKLELLTNKDYFNTDKVPKWTWAARRKELSELAGTDELLKGLADKSAYALIADDLRKGFSATEIRKAKMKALKGVSDEKDRNVTLIEDKQNDIAKYSAMDFAALEAQKAGYEKQIAEHNLSMVKASKSDEKVQTAAKIDALINERNNLAVADRNERTRLQNAVSYHQNELTALKRKAEDLKSKTVDVQAHLNKIAEKEALQWNGDTECPCCGQALPPARVEAAKDAWEREKAATIEVLKGLVEKGKAVNVEVEKELTILRKQYAEVESAESLAIAELDNFTPNPRITALDGEIAALKARNAETPTNTNDGIKAEIRETEAHLADIRTQLAYKGLLEDFKSRVEQLKAANREITDKEMVLKTAVQQIDAYVAETVSLVTDTINALFDNGVSFALFTENYAGAESELKETCTCMYNGRIYSAMSSGEKFIANLVVAKALQKAYGVCLPLFCDDAEGFTETLPDTEQQIIMLTATPGAVLENCIYLQKQ